MKIFFFQNYGKKLLADSYKEHFNPVTDIYHMANENVMVKALK